MTVGPVFAFIAGRKIVLRYAFDNIVGTSRQQAFDEPKCGDAADTVGKCDANRAKIFRKKSAHGGQKRKASADNAQLPNFDAKIEGE